MLGEVKYFKDYCVHRVHILEDGAKHGINVDNREEIDRRTFKRKSLSLLDRFKYSMSSYNQMKLNESTDIKVQGLRVKTKEEEKRVEPCPPFNFGKLFKHNDKTIPLQNGSSNMPSSSKHLSTERLCRL